MVVRNLYINYTDSELMALLKVNKQDGFEELYNRYGQKLFSYFFRMLWKNKELAEDFTQELFIKIINSADSFSEEKSFSTWIYSIANNMCKNEYRKQSVRVNHSTSAPIPQTVQAVNPDWKIFKEAVFECINGLSEDKKSLYLLRFQDNLPVQEISKILDIPEGTVKSRIFYLLKELKLKLKGFETLITYP